MISLSFRSLTGRPFACYPTSVSYCGQAIGLCEWQSANEISALPVSDELAATCTAALLDTFVAKKVTVPWRATQEFTGACLLEAFCDGFACFLHEKVGKDGENTAFRGACKGLK